MEMEKDNGNMNMHISMDIHEKSVDIDMKDHIHATLLRTLPPPHTLTSTMYILTRSHEHGMASADDSISSKVDSDKKLHSPRSSNQHIELVVVGGPQRQRNC